MHGHTLLGKKKIHLLLTDRNNSFRINIRIENFSNSTLDQRKEEKERERKGFEANQFSCRFFDKKITD